MWSWVLAAIGVTGIFLVGRKTIWGWLILCINECLWIAYALATDQYGFIVAAVAYGIVYIKSFIHWKKDHKIDNKKYPEFAIHGNIDHRFIKID
jgi:hypothetical protein